MRVVQDFDANIGGVIKSFSVGDTISKAQAESLNAVEKGLVEPDEPVELDEPAKKSKSKG